MKATWFENGFDLITVSVLTKRLGSAAFAGLRRTGGLSCGRWYLDESHRAAKIWANRCRAVLELYPSEKEFVAKG